MSHDIHQDRAGQLLGHLQKIINIQGELEMIIGIIVVLTFAGISWFTIGEYERILQENDDTLEKQDPPLELDSRIRSLDDILTPVQKDPAIKWVKRDNNNV